MMTTMGDDMISNHWVTVERKHALPDRDRYVLRCRTFREASEYAAESDWWLHSWTWEEADTDLQVVDQRPVEPRPPNAPDRPVQPYPDLDEAERWATDSYWSTGLREIITELRQARAALDFYRRDRNRHRENEKRLRNWIWELGLCGPPGSEIREAASKVLFDG